MTRRVRLWPALLALLGAVGGVAPAGAAPLVVTASARGACPAVLAVGLRGSGEAFTPATLGMGPTLLATYRGLSAGLAPRRLTARGVGLRYPAVEATQATLLDGRYTASVAAGAKLLTTYVSVQARRCPGQRLVVLGYSQGAQAVGDALALVPAPAAPHVAAVVLLGDPAYDASQRRVARGARAADGALGARPVPARWVARTASYCLAGDFVCNDTPAAATACDNGAAAGCPHYAYVSSGTARAAGAAVARLLSGTTGG